MAKLVNKGNKAPKAFEESLKQVWTVEEFIKEHGAPVSLVENPQKVNAETGQANIFFVCGDVTGSVAQKVQKAIRETSKAPEKPVIGLFETSEGEEVYTLYEQGTSSNVLFIFEE